MRKVVKMGGLVYKTPFITNLNFEINSLEEVKQLKNTLTTQEYDGLYQNLYEVELWDVLPWEYRRILCPILNYDAKTYTLTMLCIPPLMDEVEAMKVAEDKCISKIVEIAGQLGATTTEIDDFFHKLKILCNSTDLVIEDILHNLSNIGYHPNFGLRVIDYGLSQELLEEEANV